MTVDWSAGSSGSVSGAEFVQQAIYPQDSIIHDLLQYGQGQTEGVDAYIVGSILTVAAAVLARKVWMRMGYKNVYPNLYSMLAGKAGDRKSSTINLYRAMARLVLSEERLMSQSFSPETLFDEFDINAGGNPDKLWIVDDGNAVLTDWEKNVNGERTSARFLELYDCCGLSENFRRNKTKNNPQTRREIHETSTNVLFGVTFNKACFQGQQVRMGIARRFLYYIGDGHGRIIIRPTSQTYNHLGTLLGRLRIYAGEIDFDSGASAVWEQYQKQNRELSARTDRLHEYELNRLNSAPTHVQKIAIIFEFCRTAKSSLVRAVIREDTLQLAIEHVEECLRAARFLDQIANRATISDDAEILLAKIRIDFGHDRRQQDPKSIYLSRTELTARYASHGKRRGSLTAEDLYLRIIPALIRQNLAQLSDKKGKLEIYAFRKE